MADVYLDILGRIANVQKDIKQLQTDMGKLGEKSEEVNKTVRKEFENTGNVASNLGHILTSVFSVAAITAFVKKLIEVRSEWEKQEAVIKTITGSQIQASNAMKDLRKLSDLSTSSMKELTDAYVRLSSQGIKPTFDQMKKMIDVATAQGRSFGQLAEAIFDAVNTNTKGLRDIGIVSKIQGDKIQLSFKGITETVDLTAESLVDFITRMGELPGVAGATEEVAKTMAGAVDDIGDAWEHFFDDTSKASEVFLQNLLKVVTGAVNILDVLVKSGLSFKQREKEQLLIDDLLYAFDKIKAETAIVTTEEIKQAGAIELVVKQIEILKKSLPGLSEKELPAANLALYNLNQQLKELYKLGIETPDIIIEDIKGVTEATVDSIKDVSVDAIQIFEENIEKMKEDYNAYMDWYKAQKQQETTWEQLTEDEKTDIKEWGIDKGLELYDTIRQASLQNMNAELKAAEGNEKKQEAIKRKYAKRDQAFAIGDALIKGALAVMDISSKWAGVPPVMAALIVLQAILTAAQVATIKAQKFATGVLDLKGRGTDTSDSIPAMLSRGESVMTAKETDEYYPYLKSMKEGKFPKLQLELMNDFAKMRSITNNNLNYDNSKEIQVLRSIDKKLGLSKPEYIYVNGKRIIKYNGLSSHVN